MLYLVATPIGNLGDITLRALEVLRSCDYILCEDTRHSQILLHHYEIKKPLKSFHQFSEAALEEGIIQDLRNERKIALITDAGTPGISDPGSRLVKRCRKEGLRVTAIPGACAAIAALCCSGLDTNQFQFYGFLPRTKGKLKDVLIEILRYRGTSVCYESPKRLISLLTLINEIDPERGLVVLRELTKVFEEISSGTAAELLRSWKSRQVKGEIVLLISRSEDFKQLEWQKLTPEEHVKALEETYHISRNEAIKLAAKTRGIPKRSLYSSIQKSR
jgi:16S rRNA (cytidine1402-2'-O)-methyltransferase